MRVHVLLLQAGRLLGEEWPWKEEQTGEKKRVRRRGEWLVAFLPGREGVRELGARGVEHGIMSLSLWRPCLEKNPDYGACGNLEGDYEVGQVANSLFRGKATLRGSTGRLAPLFRSVNPQLQPVYVPVPKVSHCVLLRME